MKSVSGQVPQGSVLGPLLFTLYTRHLPALLTIQCVMFADDILLFFSSPSQQNCARVLSSALSDLSVLVDGLGLQINVKKNKQCLSCHGLSLVQMMFSSIVTAGVTAYSFPPA